jgi:protease-4
VKAAGKRVVVWGGNFDQKRYLIAAHASEIYLHPMGMVLIEGFGRHRNYYRDALDKVGVTVNLMKVGTYKSFAEPFIGNGPSQAASEAEAFLYNGLWNAYTAQVEQNRKLPAGAIMAMINDLPKRMEAAGGDAAKLAQSARLVDGLKTRDELRAMMIKGFGRHRNYYRDALDKIGVTVNLMKVGTYKSFAEPYIGNGPSDASTEAEAFLYNALWGTYTAEVEKNRKLPAGAVMAMIDELPKRMEAVGGDTGKLALAAKLVDGLKTRDEIRAMMIKRGTLDLEGKSFRQVGFDDYVARHHPKLFGDAVGVIVASGDITDGSAGPGAIGGQSTSNMIRRAREDNQIKAVVLRVDSPGGSAFGSELIRRELELTRAAGKPVIVSMGNVAASGGYWISMAADEVIADPSTITGSIGVFAILPTADKVIDKLGIHTAGVTTTWLADAYNPLRPLDPRFAQVVQSSINHIYSEFTTKAAQARKTTPEKIDAVAQGRVWTGVQAKERGLVDRLGSYRDALASAAGRAKLAPGYRVAYIEREGSAVERVLGFFGASAAQAFTIQVKLGLLPNGLPAGAVADVTRELGWLGELADSRKPFAAITHCLCMMP